MSLSRDYSALFERLRREPHHRVAWQEFVEACGPVVVAWCRRWGAQEADAEDVLQVVLLKLYEQISKPTYDRDRCFRAWLKAVAHNAWCDFTKSQQRPDQARGNAILHESQALEAVAAQDDSLKRIDAEYATHVLGDAMRRVRGRVAPATWEAFRLTALMGLSGAEAGKQLGMAASLVYLHRHHVRNHLREELKRLDRNDDISGLHRSA